jgi:hypothetical protein
LTSGKTRLPVGTHAFALRAPACSAHPTGGGTAIPHKQELTVATSVIWSEKGCEEKESVMPMIFFLWAIPAVIVIGGGAYYLMHVH